MGIHARKAEEKKRTKKRKHSGWTRFCKAVKILDSRWFAVILAIVWSVAVYGKEQK